MNTEAALRTLGRHRRRMALESERTEIVKLRQRLIRQHSAKLWLHHSLVAIGFVVVAGGTVALLLSL